MTLAKPESTLINIASLETTLSAAQNQYTAAIEQAMLFERDVVSLLKTKLENICYEIPALIQDELRYSLDELTSKLLENNITTSEYKAKIAGLNELLDNLRISVGANDTTYKSRLAELNYVIAQSEEYKNSVSKYAASKYSEFYSTESKYALAVADCSGIENKLILLTVFYENGSISELELLTEQFKLYQSQAEAYAVFVAKSNLLMEIELMSQGIVIN